MPTCGWPTSAASCAGKPPSSQPGAGSRGCCKGHPREGSEGEPSSPKMASVPPGRARAELAPCGAGMEPLLLVWAGGSGEEGALC